MHDARMPGAYTILPPLPADIGQLAATENLFVLATRPGEETLCCGGLIALALERGRLPVVAVLTDGGGTDPAEATRRAEARARESRAATAALGLPEERLFLLGLYEGMAPASGTPFHEQLLAALIFLMWSRDCNVIVAPRERAGRHDHAVAEAAARTVAEQTGVGLVLYDADGEPVTRVKR